MRASLLFTRVVLCFVIVGLATGAGTSTLAQEATPAADDEAMPEGITFEILSTGSVAAFPELPADLQLFRIGVAAGASTTLSPDPALSLAYVEAGEITMVIDGEVTVVRSPSEEGPEAVETFGPGEAFTLEPTDSVLIPLTALGGELRNEGTEEASLLVVNIISFASFDTEGDATPAP